MLWKVNLTLFSEKGKVRKNRAILIANLRTQEKCYKISRQLCTNLYVQLLAIKVSRQLLDSGLNF